MGNLIPVVHIRFAGEDSECSSGRVRGFVCVCAEGRRGIFHIIRKLKLLSARSCYLSNRMGLKGPSVLILLRLVKHPPSDLLRQCLTLCSTPAPGSVTSATGRTTTRGTPTTAAREGGETISAKREEETEEGAKSDQKKEINSSGAIPKRDLSKMPPAKK